MSSRLGQILREFCGLVNICNVTDHGKRHRTHRFFAEIAARERCGVSLCWRINYVYFVMEHILEFFKCLGDRNEHENLQFHDSYMKSAVETLSADEKLEDLRENSYNFHKVRDVKPLVSE